MWFWMLHLMRRPWMRRLQAASIAWMPERGQVKARASLVRQNRWARRWGLPLLTFAVNVFLASVILTAVFYAVLWMIETGLLSGGAILRENEPVK